MLLIIICIVIILTYIFVSLYFSKQCQKKSYDLDDKVEIEKLERSKLIDEFNEEIIPLQIHLNTVKIKRKKNGSKDVK